MKDSNCNVSHKGQELTFLSKDEHLSWLDEFPKACLYKAFVHDSAW